jgi:hypothetical protein
LYIIGVIVSWIAIFMKDNAPTLENTISVLKKL